MEESQRQQLLNRVDTYTRFLDAQFKLPLIPIRFGIDGLIGLIPGVGDLLTFCLGLYPLWIGVRLGVSKKLLVRMLINLVIDTVIGTIPVLGDLFDIGFKANLRNANMLRKWAEDNRDAII